MAKTDFGVMDQSDMARILIDLANKIHPLVLGSIFRSRSQIQFLAGQLLKNQVPDAKTKKKIIDFLCSESGSHDYTINRREAAALGLKVEKSDASLYEMLKKLYHSIRMELEFSKPYSPDSALGTNQNANYKCVRALIESTAFSGYAYLSEGELSRVQVQTPLGPQDGVRDNRTFEGWRER